MPNADEMHVEGLTRRLHELGLSHLHVRRHGALLIIESGPEGDRMPHARLRRDTVHLWMLEIHGRRWEPTPFRATMDELVELLTGQFGWVVAPPWEP